MNVLQKVNMGGSEVGGFAVAPNLKKLTVSLLKASRDERNERYEKTKMYSWD
jgi:hypothetical protein